MQPDHSKIIRQCNLSDPEATLAAGRDFAPVLRRGDCVLFYGDLGMGKTTFIRGVLNGLAERAGQGALDVPSPTFTLVQLYDGAGVTVHHYDLYRLPDETTADMLTEIGFDDAIQDGIALVEWPERLGAHTPSDALQVILSDDDKGGRVCTFQGDAPWAKRLA